MTPAGSGPVEDDHGGRGRFGDGRTAPLYESRASRLKGGRPFTPNVIRVWLDRIEEYEYHALRRKETRAMSYQQVSEVTLSRGLVWSDIAVESTGGRTVRIDGVPKDDAERVKKLIDDAVLAARGGGHAVPDLADQLTKLAALRDQGILTEAEFARQKAKLLQ
jgi:hypothetical protein